MPKIALLPLFMLHAVPCVAHLPKEKEMQNILPPSQSRANGIERKAN
jgi:hypothetical protein